MRVLISGSSGFLGSSFLEFCKINKIPFLELKHKTSENDLNDYSKIFYANNFEGEEVLSRVIAFKPTVFIHFAWRGVSNEKRQHDQYRYNIDMTLSSIEFAKKVNCFKWIGFGSQAEYGPKSHAIRENEFCEPLTDYGKSKLSLAISSLGLCDYLKIEGAWVRVFSVYGERDHSNSFISMLTRKMLKNEDIDVTDCTQKWDYLHVEDMIDALYRLILKFKGGIYNLGSGHSVVLKDVVDILYKYSSSTSKVNFGAVASNEKSINFLLADVSKIQQQTDWEPKINLEQGLLRVIEYAKLNSK